MSKCCCCNDAPSLADDPALVFSIYAIAFIPLAFVYALDFITDKWRTIRETRRSGMIQLLISLPSLGSLIFYIVVQINNKDYKEAAAAIAVAVFNSYHVLRSIWGLILLYEFRNWNVSALRCLVQLGYRAPVYDYSYDVKNMLSKMKSCRSLWKRPLLRLVDYFKTKIVSVYNWSIQSFSSLPSSTLTSSSSRHPDGTTDENHSRPSHESNSCSTPSDSTIDGNHSYPLSGQNSFHSTLPDSTIVENQTLLLSLADMLKTIYGHFNDWAIYGARPSCTDMKETCKTIYNWAVGSMEEEDLASDLALEDIKRTVDNHMVVNSSLIDNEFSNVDLPVRPVLFSRVHRSDPERHSVMARFVASCLKSRKPEECSVRWLVSFLAKFGHEWLVDTRGLKLEGTESQAELQGAKPRICQDLAVLACAHTTHGSVGDKGSTESFVTVFSPYHEYCTGDVDFRNSYIFIAPQCMLPFKMNADFASTLYFGDHVATIRDAAKDDWHKTSLNKLNDTERSAVKNITALQLACFSTLMENSIAPLKEGECLNLESNVSISWKGEDPRIDTLMYQLGSDGGEDYEKIFQALPVRKEASSSFLWDNNPNFLLLQASVHVDNYIALELGDRLCDYVEEYREESQKGESEHTSLVFETQYGLEMRRLQSEKERKRVYSPISFDTRRFIGSVAETVRSILASWVKENDTEAAGWNASIAPDHTTFRCSKQLCSAFSEMQNIGLSHQRIRSLYMRLLWEVQAHLHWKVGEELRRKAGDIRKSPFLIMLFILGFPALKLEKAENEGIFSDSNRGDHTVEFNDGITVNPVAGPQDLRILFTCDHESKTVSVIFRPESPVFNWQEWKDAFMGRFAAEKDWGSAQELSHNVLVRTEANRSDLCSPVVYIAAEKLGKYYEVSCWSGWPPFMPQIAQFEMPQISKFEAQNRNRIKDERSLSYSELFAQVCIEFIGALNVAIDTHFQQRTDVTTIYTDGCHALEEGRADDALKLFGRCIALHGHKEALHDAFDIIMEKRPVCDTQEVSLQTSMDVRFKVLLNQSHVEDQNTATDEIDLATLADYFGRVYEQTGSKDAGLKKVLALFYENGANSAVSEEAIEALESFIVREQDSGSSSLLKFYLAIAHQSLFHESQDPAHRKIAAKYLWGLRGWDIKLFPDENFALNIGYLLEKGLFVGRNAYRKNAMIESFCEQTAWGDEKMLRVMFDRVFVKQASSEEGNMEVDRQGRVFGTGIRPNDARTFYPKSFNWFPKCTNRLALLYHKGAQGVPANPRKAEEKYLAAIEKGNEDALCNMGVLKCDSVGGNAGISYLKSAVQAGSSSGMNNLAVAYELGNGVNRDVLEAERLYKQAIEVDDNPIAMYNLAVLYMWGVPEVRTDENMSESERIISDLTRPETELEPLYTLEEQVRRLCALSNNGKEPAMALKVVLEELDECVAYVKILEDCGGDRVRGVEEGV